MKVGKRNGMKEGGDGRVRQSCQEWRITGGTGRKRRRKVNGRERGIGRSGRKVMGSKGLAREGSELLGAKGGGVSSQGSLSNYLRLERKGKEGKGRARKQREEEEEEEAEVEGTRDNQTGCLMVKFTLRVLLFH